MNEIEALHTQLSKSIETEKSLWKYINFVEAQLFEYYKITGINPSDINIHVNNDDSATPSHAVSDGEGDQVDITDG